MGEIKVVVRTFSLELPSGGYHQCLCGSDQFEPASDGERDIWICVDCSESFAEVDIFGYENELVSG